MSKKSNTEKTPTTGEPSVAPARQLIMGMIFGFAFGFLLQKGGVGNYHILIGQLLLRDWTVVKVMLTAIVVGMIGIAVLHRFAGVRLHIKPTRLGSNIIGGLLFGVGFGLLGYCPGTAATALGQGSWDVLFGMVGLVAGSWIYAEFSSVLNRSVKEWGDLGELTLPDILRLPRGITVIIMTIILGGVLLILRSFTS